MKKKVILITGASSGFGKDVAHELIKQGHVVYATARRVGLMKDLEALGGKVFKLDVTQQGDIDKVVSTLLDTEGRIDVLFNNAGFGAYGAIEAVSDEQIKYQFDVNLFGVSRMLKAVLPTMRKQKSGTIVNTASLVSHLSTPIIGWYAATKHALKAVSDSLRLEVAHLGINVVLIDPGAVKTGFEDVSVKALEQINHPDDYKSLVSIVKKYISKTYAQAPGPQSTTDCIVKAINSNNPSLRYKTTLDSKLLGFIKKVTPDVLVDKIISSQLKIK